MNPRNTLSVVNAVDLNKLYLYPDPEICPSLDSDPSPLTKIHYQLGEEKQCDKYFFKNNLFFNFFLHVEIKIC